MTITPMMARIKAKGLAQQHQQPLSNPKFQHKWAMIQKHLTTFAPRNVSRGFLHVYANSESIRLVKKRGNNIMRINSRLDWVWYEPKDLANAIDTNTVLDYYAQQLLDPRSYPNTWKRPTEELDTKEHYAKRAGRQLDIHDNL
mgnify:FL=1|tara:strand:+ start:189 stop:617 length:429 start_codon:yes stop_codon:yes gene_type:complete